MPSWKIENAATAAAVAFPLLDVAGILGEGQLVFEKSTVCCLLYFVEYMSSLWPVSIVTRLSLGVEGSKVADAEFDSPSR